MPALPHFVQIGDSPVLRGDGAETLDCTCRGSVLVAGYRPGSLLAIRIQCFRCGEVTVTRSLAPGAVLPPRLRPLRAEAIPAPTPLQLPPGITLACESEVARADALARPADPPGEPLSLTAASVAEWEAAYDRVSGGLWEAHRRAVQARSAAPGVLPRHKLAWALVYLRQRVEQPGWTWFGGDADGAAVAHMAAFRHFLACWSHHPLFPAMAASTMQDGFSLHAMAVPAAANALARSGNRVAIAAPDSSRIDGFAIGPPGEEHLAVQVQPLGHFEWPELRPAEPTAIRGAVLDAVSAGQARINLKRPGILVLSPGAVRPVFDQPLVDAINAVLRAQGRRHRGLTAIAAILPKLISTRQPDQVGFGWSFYPIANPHQAAGVTTRIGSREDFAPFQG